LRQAALRRHRSSFRTVLRLLIGVVVGAALGFASGWFAFGDPLGDDDAPANNTPTQADVDREAARVSRVGYASCTQRDYPTNVWDCRTADRVGRCDFWLATVKGDRVTVKSRPPDGINERLARC
jgi:hypothetical protein